MTYDIRFVERLADRAAASSLRRRIDELYQQKYGDGVASPDPTIDGRTLIVGWKDRAVASVDVHWGADGSFPSDRAGDLYLDTLPGGDEPKRIIMLDPILVHPEWTEHDFDLDLLEHVARFAISKGVRWVVTDAEADVVPAYRALGFQPRGTPRQGHMGAVVTVALDLHDTPHLAAIEAPFLEEAKQKVEEAEHEPMWRRLVRTLREMRTENAAFLEELDDDQLARLIVGGAVGKVKPGRRLVSEGREGRDLFLVLTGTVEVKRNGRLLAVLGPGEVFGEIGFLTGANRSADVIAAAEGTSVLKLSEHTLRELIAADPELGANVALGVAKALCFKLIGTVR